MNDRLFAAIKAGDLKALGKIIETDPGAARAIDANGVSAVLSAVYHDNPAAVAALRSTGIDLNVFEAAAVGDADRVKHLLQTKAASATDYNTDGFHPLGLAAFFRHFEVLKILLGFGADVSAPSRNKMRVTALHSAIAGGDRKSALALIAAGADVNAVQQDGFTALHEAAQNGDREVVDALLVAGADPSLTLGNGSRPVDLARKHGHPEIAAVLEQTTGRT
jgi:ankyrin repeat protein